MKVYSIKIVFVAYILLVFISKSLASDHADPIKLSDPLEPDLTGLFVFPDENNLIFILNTYRGLNFDEPYYLEPFEYRINVDLHSKISFDDKSKNARYGGGVDDPEGISSDAVVKVKLNNDASLNNFSIDGIKDEGVRVWTGVRDDPFIFPRFFGTNVIAIVVSVPVDNFPKDQDNWLVWATSHYYDSGDQIDHVGRSNRTQLARLDALNTMHPNQHVEFLRKEMKKEERVAAVLRKVFAPLAGLDEVQFQIRPYDIQPDVLIYTNQKSLGFPNGRRLTDDVAALTCLWGDCILQDVSYIEGKDFPRETKNDKAFLDNFPYLAEPWPSQGHANNHTHKNEKTWWYIALFLIVILAFYVIRRKRAS